MTRWLNILTVTIIALSALTACTIRGGLSPDSGGRPYEVVVVGDADSTICRLLTQDVPALPQAEPTFDVTHMLRKNLENIGSTMRLARNIVVVDTNDKSAKETKVKYERNVWASPQLIVYISAPSLRQLHHDAPRLKSVASLLASHEMGIATNALSRKHNTRMEDVVKKMFGIDINLPSDMKRMKRGKDFIWISNDSPTAMTNICIYTSLNRDSVMQENIKGETDAMFMTTVSGSVMSIDTKHGDHPLTIHRGLWEMKGDAMGGPFVQHVLHNCGKHPTLVVEAFVYAPGRKKRNLLFATEAALYTVK